MNEFYVYEWYIIETNEVFYVGKGKKGRYKNINNRNKFFKDMYNTHNCDVRIIRNNLSEEEAFNLEKEIIKYYRENYKKYRLTNQTDGGDGISGWKPSEEFRVKQSKLNKIRWQNENYRNKIIAIRNDKNGIYKSQEFRKKISNLVRGENNPNYGNNWSEEQKEKLRQKMLGKYKGKNNPNSKQIMCIETGEVFNCILDAQIKYNINTYSSLTIALNQEVTRTAGNKHWIFITNDNKHWLNDRNKRFKYLLWILSITKPAKYYINIKTLEIYNKSQLINKMNIGIRRFNKEIKNNKEYVLIKEYYGRLIQ